MSRVVTTAGRADTPPSARKEAIARIRRILRQADSSDDETDDAIEAIAELARMED